MNETLPAPTPAVRDADAALIAAGAACVVLGGLTAAVTGPLDLAKGSWLAAYLVLVCGVGTLVTGRAQRHWSPAHRAALPQAAAWAAGNLAVVAGSLATLPLLVDTGGALLVAALAIALHRSRTATPRPAAAAYRAVLILLLVCIPIGSALAHLRA